MIKIYCDGCGEFLGGQDAGDESYSVSLCPGAYRAPREIYCEDCGRVYEEIGTAAKEKMEVSETEIGNWAKEQFNAHKKKKGVPVAR